MSPTTEPGKGGGFSLCALTVTLFNVVLAMGDDWDASSSSPSSAGGVWAFVVRGAAFPLVVWADAHPARSGACTT
jgi:hypothetical protein